MLRKRNPMDRWDGLCAWLVLTALAAAAVLFVNGAAWAQQDSTTSSLAAPVLTVETDGDAVELRWEAVPGATRYEVWTWTSGGGWERLDDGSLTGTAFRHSGVTAGTTYYYAVRALDANGAEGAWTEFASATPGERETATATSRPVMKPTDDATAASAPAMTLTATATATTTPPSASVIASADAGTALPAPTVTAEAGADQIRLKWNAVAGAVRYELWTWWDPVTDWQRLDDGNLTGTAHVHSGLAAGTTYYYAVRAVDASGATSAWSEYASATVPGAGAPAATATATATPTATAAITGTVTSTPTPTSAAEITGTATPTATPTSAAEITGTATPTATPTSAAEITGTAT
ncbi:MAG: fibronectin type III domain-containing protein, partial [Caldilineaceae bacterium]|nr:fibronectin type III domain-containing protein [Caldilineaceae bacterium]